MLCFYCAHSKGSHDGECPLNSNNLFENWWEGYRDGRSGKSRQKETKIYMMGYLRGESALESAQNGG